MQRIRVCQLITELGPAGAERCVYELARRLDRTRFHVRVAALRGGAVADWLAEANVPTMVLGVRGKWDVGKLGRLVRWLRGERIDLLHTHLFHADLAGRIAGRLAGVEHLVHTVHTAEERYRPWQFAFARLAAGTCERIVAVSPSARDHHARLSHLPAERYTVIANGVDPAAYARDEQARETLRNEWSITERQTLLAFVGRLSEEKGLDVLLAAMGELEKKQAPVKLVVAGDGPERKMLERFCASAPAGRNVRMLGFVADVRGVLSAADALVMPSRWEGFGLAAAEAMAASLPVVATRVAGLKDVVVENETALLVDVDDVDALAAAISRLAGDAQLSLRLAAAGRRRVCEKFDISACVAAHEALYEQLAGE